MRGTATLLLTVLLSACAVPQSRPPQEETPAQARERRAKAPLPAYNLSGYPPAARDGYIDGCESARRSAYGRKDAARYAADARYRTGWDDGHAICSRN